jgi:hypothetical protein
LQSLGLLVEQSRVACGGLRNCFLDRPCSWRQVDIGIALETELIKLFIARVEHAAEVVPDFAKQIDLRLLTLLRSRREHEDVSKMLVHALDHTR